MVQSIEAYGFKIPLLVSEHSEIIDGDLRLKAAKKLGFTEVPVIVCDDWSLEQIRAFRLIVNPLDWTVDYRGVFPDYLL